MKQQDEMLFNFQRKWFEVVLKERGSECSNSPLGVFEKSEKGNTVKRKISALSNTLKIGKYWRNILFTLVNSTSNLPGPRQACCMYVREVKGMVPHSKLEV